MGKRQFVAVMATALAGIVMTGGLLANMAFKVPYTLLAASSGVSKSGTNTLSLPYRRQAGVNTAGDLMTSIGLSSVYNVQKFLKSSDGLQVYTGRKGSPPNFDLVSGEGYFVRMASTVNYEIKGSHDDSFQVELDAATAGVSKSGTNFYSHPYHSLAGTAKALMDAIGLANVQNVQRFLRSSDSVQSYTGRKGSGPDFPLVAGEAYYIKMNSTVNYVPSHY
jgi:hypothetical protein